MGDQVRRYLACFAATFVACLVVAGVANAQGACYFILTIGGAVCHLSWQLYSVNFENPRDCGKMFLVRNPQANSAIMLLNFLCIISGEWRSRIYHVGRHTWRLFFAGRPFCVLSLACTRASYCRHRLYGSDKR